MYFSLYYIRYYKVTLRLIFLKMYKIGKINYIIVVFYFSVLLFLNLYFRIKLMRLIIEFFFLMSV